MLCCQIKNESQNRYRANVKIVACDFIEMLGIISVDTILTISLLPSWILAVTGYGQKVPEGQAIMMLVPSLLTPMGTAI
jgi:hypothetical protein